MNFDDYNYIKSSHIDNQIYIKLNQTEIKEILIHISFKKFLEISSFFDRLFYEKFNQKNLIFPYFYF